MHSTYFNDIGTAYLMLTGGSGMTRKEAFLSGYDLRYGIHVYDSLSMFQHLFQRG